MVVIIFLLHMTTEVTPSDLRVWFGWIPTYRRSVPIDTDSLRRSRDLSADRRLRFLGHPVRTRRRAGAHRTRQSRRSARADRRIKTLDRQPEARAARRSDRPLVEKRDMTALQLRDIPPDERQTPGRLQSRLCRYGRGTQQLLRRIDYKSDIVRTKTVERKPVHQTGVRQRILAFL